MPQKDRGVGRQRRAHEPAGFGDVAAARAAMKSRQMTEDQSTDAKDFAEPGTVLLFLATEEVVIAP